MLKRPRCTFFYSWPYLTHHLYFTTIVFAAFTFLGKIIFPVSDDFFGSVKSSQTVLSYSMGAFTSTDLLDQHSYLGIAFLFVFYWFFCCVVVNWYMVILEEGFREGKIMVKLLVDEKQDIFCFARKTGKTLRRAVQKQTDLLERFVTWMKKGFVALKN